MFIKLRFWIIDLFLWLIASFASLIKLHEEQPKNCFLIKNLYLQFDVVRYSIFLLEKVHLIQITCPPSALPFNIQSDEYHFSLLA